MSNPALSISISADTKAVSASLADLRAKLESTGASSQHLDRVTAALSRIEASSQRTTDSIRKMLGVNATDEAVRSFERAQTIIRKYGDEFDAVRAKFNPLFAVQNQLKRQIAEIADAERIGALSAAEAAQARQRATEATSRQVAVLQHVQGSNDNETNRFGLRGYQVGNLRSQGLDAATMLASGSSLTQVISTQGAQVYEAMASGEKGVKGVAEGLASLVTPTTVAVGGFAALAAGVLYFATRADSSVKSAADALKNYREKLDELGPGFERAAAAADTAFKQARPETANVAAALIGESRDTLQASLAAEMEKLIPKTQEFSTEWKNVVPEVVAVQNQIRPIGKDLEAGRITVGQFRDQIARIRRPDDTSKAVKEIVDGLLAASVNARDLTDALIAVGAAAGSASEKMGRLGTTGTKTVTLGSRFGENPLDYRMNPDLKGDLREQLLQQRAAMRGPDTDLDIRAITARTVAEKELIAVERQRRALQDVTLDQNPERDRALKKAREEAAAITVRTEAIRSASDALRTSQATFDQAGLSGYAAELAAINAKFAEMITNAQGASDAVDSLRKAQELEVAALRARTERSLFDPQAETLRGLNAQAETLGMPVDQARRVLALRQAQNDLTRAGIDLNSDLARAYEASACQVADHAERLQRIEEAFVTA